MEDYQQLDTFQQQRDTLVSLIDQQFEAMESLGMTERAETVRVLKERVRSENFKILVIGEFKRGKSTFINALLRKDVLPAYVIPCTAIINEVKWGEEPRALLYPRPPADGSVSPPQEIPVDQLAEYVAIKDDTQKEQEVRENLYQKVELLWPLDLCRRGVEIIDSPGLNEDIVRQKVTLDYVARVDAILFVLSCTELGPSISEDTTIRSLSDSGYGDIFFICNRFDAVRPSEREMLKRHGIRKLAPRTQLGAEHVFFISAQQALDGHLNHDLTLVEQSGLSPVETSLQRFLANERGRVKILTAAGELKMGIDEARRTIPEREARLHMDLKELEEKYAAAQKPLQQLEQERKLTVALVARTRKDMRQSVYEKARLFYGGVIPKVEGWAKDYTIQMPLGMREMVGNETRENAFNRIVKEVLTHMGRQLESEMTEWQKSELQPFLAKVVDGLMSDINTNMDTFLRNLDMLRVDLASGVVPPPVVSLSNQKLSPLDRVLSAIGGFSIGGVGLGALGATFGYKEMFKALLPNIGFNIVLGVMIGLNPILLIPAIGAQLLGGLAQGGVAMKGINEKVKQEVGKRYATYLRDAGTEQSNKIADTVAEKFMELEAAVDAAMGTHIQDLRDQVESALAEKRQGQAQVDQKAEELKTARERLDAIDVKLDELEHEVAVTQART